MFSLFTPLCNFYCALEARVAAPPTAMFATGSLLGDRLRDVKQRLATLLSSLQCTQDDLLTPQWAREMTKRQLCFKLR